jgi:glycosyltransferase involved in cell wall biosynthesis
LPFRIWKISRFFKQQHPDIIHSWHWSSDITEPLAAKLAGIPFVYTKKAMGWGNRAWKWRSRLSSKIITINMDMETFFKDIKQKVVPMPLGVDTKEYQPLSRESKQIKGIPDDPTAINVVAIANLAPVKGLELLIEAVRLIKNPKVRVVHVGDSNNDYGKALKAEYGTGQNVYFLGKQLDIKPYLQIADVFVIPTKNEGRKEGLPVAPLEAMACQRIVVGSKVPGIADILEPFPELLCKPGDAIHLAETIQRVLKLGRDEKLILELKMRQRVEQNFSLKTCILNHQKLYKTMTHAV